MATASKKPRADWLPARAALIGRCAARGPRCAGGRSPGPAPAPVRVPPPPRVTEPALPAPPPRRRLGLPAGLQRLARGGFTPESAQSRPAGSFGTARGDRVRVGDAAPAVSRAALQGHGAALQGHGAGVSTRVAAAVSSL